MNQQTQPKTRPSPTGTSGPAPAAPAGAPPTESRGYRPSDHETRIRARWESSGAFHADPSHVQSGQSKPYCILIPPPNVTAQLHLGHALNNTLQDVLARAHRMMGYETLWMPGTDHAGIATQTVVERRLMSEEGKKRTDLTRDAFVARVQAFKDEYEARITEQLKAMGCSCDWDRQRFTMDPVCARAVNEAFFRLFKDGLIYRGKRLVNWDPVTQTALADDEVEMEEVDGKFYYLRYPLVNAIVRGSDISAGESVEASKGEIDEGQALVPVTWSELRARNYPVPDGPDYADDTQAWITVATTRPETYLGDTAVAINPKDPRAKPLRGLLVELPLVGRVIPIIEDDYVVMPAADPNADGVDPKAKFATGFLKVTPAHDPNDYELGLRHELPIINVMAPDASISDKHGWVDVGDAHIFVGKPREAARTLVVREFDSRNLLEATKPYRHSVGHSYRSHAPIEPYLSDQWYVKVTDLTMRDSALRAMVNDQRTTVASIAAEVADLAATGHRGRSPGDGALRFYPDRYARTFETWHVNIRDWCISRQLWWGHRIPVWSHPRLDAEAFGRVASISQEADIAGFERYTDYNVRRAFDESDSNVLGTQTANEPFSVCVRPGRQDLEHLLEAAGFTRDPDVLDTWFSSALWPLSTMGWPDPAAAGPSFPNLLESFNPSSVLCTAREIITLWVSRMVMFNRYFLPDSWPKSHDLAQSGKGNGPLPFRDVFIHAMIQDGEGRKMSKSLGNGVDPLDIIESHGADAMRYTLVKMTTQTQDVRMPVEPDARTGKNTSPKFDEGRNFCNKLWQVTTGFALAKLSPTTPPPTDTPRPLSELRLIDKWMLSRLAAATSAVESALKNYEFSDYAEVMYKLLWWDFCDWYVEGIKPTIAGDPMQRAVLAATLQTIIRLLHPIAPFITEAIYEKLSTIHALPIPGLDLGAPRTSNLLATAAWPKLDPSLRNESAEFEFDRLRSIISPIRELRAKLNVKPGRKVTFHCSPDTDEICRRAGGLVETIAGLERITSESAPPNAAAFPIGAETCYLSNLADAVDASAERERLKKVIADNDRAIQTFEKRLSNPGYTDKAPPAMVEQTRDQLAKAQAERAAAAAALERLG